MTEPPIANKIPTVFQVGPHKLDDDYAWLQPRNNEKRPSPDVMKYISSENSWTDRYVSKRFQLAKGLLRNMLARASMMQDKSIEETLDGYHYYTKAVPGKEWPQYWRRRGTTEELLLDQNEEAKEARYISIGTLKVTPNSRFLAYTRTVQPDSPFECVLKDIKTAKTLAVIPSVSNVEWAADNTTLFYTVPDSLGRPASVRRYRIGGLQASDVVVVEEADPRFFLDVALSKDRTHMIIVSASKEMTESWVVDAKQPLSRPHLVLQRKIGLEYFVNHANGVFYIVSNWDSTYYRIFTTDRVERSMSEWHVFYQPDEDVTIEDVDFFRGYVAVWESDEAEMQCRVIPVEGGEEELLTAPMEGAAMEPGINSEYESTMLRYSYSSFTQPPVVLDYDMSSGLTTIVREKQLVDTRGNQIYKPENFVTKRLWTTPTTDDEESVPYTVAHHKDLKLDGANPLLLTGYGAYGERSSIAFATERLALLERGWVVASAHVRGGGELGKAWYEQGRQLSKKNSFLDFIKVTEEMVTQGYSRPEHIAASGASAGGLLLGAVANMRPELYRAMVLKVPFLDVTTAMLDDTLPLTVHEYDEWGDPNDPRVLEYILSYDPYRNLTAQAYPEMLVTGALLDGRVPYWHPLKYVAKLRALRSDQRSTLLRVYMETGHSGEEGRLKKYEEVVLEYAFLLSCIGARVPTAKV